MQPHILEKHFNLLFTSGLLIGLFLSFLYAHHQIMTGDQLQMIEKGYLGAYQGIWLGYGNAASVVGNVPGSLSALIIGVPLMAWDSPWAPMTFLIALHLASFLLFDSVIKQIFTPTIRLVFLTLYWLNPWFLFENILYNPSYLFFFSALHFYSAYNMRENKSFWYTLLHVLSIAMAMQLHYSWIILAIISLFLYVKKIIRVHWLALFTAVFLTLLSLIPYVQALLSNPEIAHNPGNKEGERYIGWGGVHVYPVLKAISYWFRYATFLFTHKLVLSTHFEWLPVVPLIQKATVYLYMAIVYAVGIGSLWIAWLAHKYSWNKIRPQLTLHRSTEIPDSEHWMLLYSVGAFIAVVISAILSPIVFSYWHLIIVFAFTLFPILVFINHSLSITPKRVITYLMAIVIYFMIINLIALTDSKKFSYKMNYQSQTLEYLEGKFNRE